MNTTLQTAKSVLEERYRIDAKDAGAIAEFYRRCHTQLVHTVAELEAQLSENKLLREDKAMLAELLRATEERLGARIATERARANKLQEALDEVDSETEI